MATTTAETGPAPGSERLRRLSLTQRILARPAAGALIIVVFVWLVFAAISVAKGLSTGQFPFMSAGGTLNYLDVAAQVGIIGTAVALLMIAGEFDLSIGSILGFAGMALMILVSPVDAGGFGWTMVPAVGMALLLALLIGTVNGLLVVTTKLPSFIITLGTLLIVRGLTVALSRLRTNRTQLGNLDEVSGFGLFHDVFGAKFSIFGSNFNVSILWWVALAAVVTWLLVRTRQGNWIYGTGGAVEAARNVGVPVRHVKIALFLTTAFAAFLVALIQAVEFTGADALRGTDQEFNAIIAAVVGGCLLTGGYGSAVGAAFGALLFGMVQQGIVITGIDGDWYRVFLGGVLVVAVIFNNFIRQRASRR